jgi:beta-aspartyl-dipeptidase (metallo-type)
MTGKAGILHLHLGDGPRGLDLVRRALDETELPPRVFNPTHVNRRKALLEEACDLAARGCTIDVSAFPVVDEAEEWSAADALVRYLDAGLPAGGITVSSDCGGSLPVHDAQGTVVALDYGQAQGLTETLRVLLQAGQALDRVLPAFTANAAALLRLKKKGKIAVGAYADFVVLDADDRIRDVMARGVWHVKDGMQRVFGTFETRGP